jgi:hypothetical protein
MRATPEDEDEGNNGPAVRAELAQGSPAGNLTGLIRYCANGYLPKREQKSFHTVEVNSPLL